MSSIIQKNPHQVEPPLAAALRNKADRKNGKKGHQRRNCKCNKIAADRVPHPTGDPVGAHGSQSQKGCPRTGHGGDDPFGKVVARTGRVKGKCSAVKKGEAPNQQIEHLPGVSGDDDANQSEGNEGV